VIFMSYSREIYVSKTDLSKDQKYLLDIVQAVQKGKCNPELATRNLEPLSHSR